MSMCTAGARNNTEKQLKQVLKFGNVSNDAWLKSNLELQQHLQNLNANVALNVANKIYQRNSYEIKQEFLDLLRKFFKSDAQGLDFSKPSAAAKVINDWVAEQTKNKILNLVPESVITNLTQLILVNAIYFKGNWELKFNKEHTKPETFYLSDKSETKVQMMAIIGKKFAYCHEPSGIKASSCTLPYAGGEISMTILLPHEDQKLSNIESKLEGNVLKRILSNQHRTELNVFLPKFKFEQQFEVCLSSFDYVAFLLLFLFQLSKVFSKMGAPDAFDHKLADFTGIKSANDGLHISNVIHKAIVEVNEEGTEAAAATAVVMDDYCLQRRKNLPLEFKCNRPFLFFIHDNTHQTILFMGRYAKPE